MQDEASARVGSKSCLIVQYDSRHTYCCCGACTNRCKLAQGAHLHRSSVHHQACQQHLFTDSKHSYAALSVLTDKEGMPLGSCVVHTAVTFGTCRTAKVEDAEAQATATPLPRASCLQGAFEASGSVAYTAYSPSSGHTTLQWAPSQLSATSALPAQYPPPDPLTILVFCAARVIKVSTEIDTHSVRGEVHSCSHGV